MIWKAVFFVLFVFSTAALCAANSTSAGSAILYQFRAVGDDEARIYGLVNRERDKKKLRGLNWNSRLAKLARAYSRKMANEGFFDHFDRRGKSVIDRANDSGIDDWAKIGENLFMCRGIEMFSDFAVRGWMRSPEHRKNILDRKWTSTGIGIAIARNGSIYITQIFLAD